MCIEQDQRGDYVLDTSALAEKLSIPPEYLRCQMRLGLVTSRVGAAMPPSLGTSLALASTAHGDHLSRGDEHNQAPAEVQGTKIGPDLGPVSPTISGVGATSLFQSITASISPAGPSATASATPAVTSSSRPSPVRL